MAHYTTTRYDVNQVARLNCAEMIIMVHQGPKGLVDHLLNVQATAISQRNKTVELRAKVSHACDVIDKNLAQIEERAVGYRRMGIPTDQLVQLYIDSYNKWEEMLSRYEELDNEVQAADKVLKEVDAKLDYWQQQRMNYVNSQEWWRD